MLCIHAGCLSGLSTKVDCGPCTFDLGYRPGTYATETTVAPVVQGIFCLQGNHFEGLVAVFFSFFFYAVELSLGTGKLVPESCKGEGGAPRVGTDMHGRQMPPRRNWQLL
ncbi:uncharacterized protein EI90DRAFT_1671619 [Cantharellus anzutake]|uniref:uncharacterized protein n=1 Tax=Cantharellus anzutake TaxID=1750568 RepID=UPI0019069972|nr:uncharacterized protein EI90DRAFT_1671619 [Cantharellus anzutake]KAF8308719.1 hypothetical protein EI90DRAFT_1671619 [Cantharellus anzutake]